MVATPRSQNPILSSCLWFELLKMVEESKAENSEGCLTVFCLSGAYSSASIEHLLQQAVKGLLAKTVSPWVTISLSGLFFVDCV